MSSREPLQLYLFLGAADSDRRAILADLIEGGIETDERAVVVLSANEPPSELDQRLPNIVRWTWADGQIVIPSEALDATHAFVVADGRGNPVDQVEAFKQWLELHGGELARVFCVVNCQLAEQHKELVAWYEACVHFADVVLLARREGVSNKWLSDFQNRFKDQFYPCLFEFVKDGRVKNPPLLLEPQARRMSHVFDEPDWDIVGGEDDEDDDERESNEEVEVVAEVDPYFERRAGGRRVKEIPDISRILPPPSAAS